MLYKIFFEFLDPHVYCNINFRKFWNNFYDVTKDFQDNSNLIIVVTLLKDFWYVRYLGHESSSEAIKTDKLTKESMLSLEIASKKSSTSSSSIPFT